MMNKERLTAFTDAVLAIIMTILVLELERPQVISWSALWDLRMNFFAYTISFFWLGTMWVNLHNTWDKVETINRKIVWISLLLLFFSSFFPYVTSLVSMTFHSSVAQSFYGIVVLLVTATNLWLYHEVAQLHDGAVSADLARAHNRWIRWDIVLKLAGLVLTLTIWPEAMMWAVLLTALILVLPNSI